MELCWRYSKKFCVVGYRILWWQLCLWGFLIDPVLFDIISYSENDENFIPMHIGVCVCLSSFDFVVHFCILHWVSSVSSINICKTVFLCLHPNSYENMWIQLIPPFTSVMAIAQENCLPRIKWMFHHWKTTDNLHALSDRETAAATKKCVYLYILIRERGT